MAKTANSKIGVAQAAGVLLVRADHDEIHDQFSPDADEGLCPACGAPPKQFRVFALCFVAAAMLITGAAFGFIGGCEWYAAQAHTAQTLMAGGSQ